MRHRGHDHRRSFICCLYLIALRLDGGRYKKTTRMMICRLDIRSDSCRSNNTHAHTHTGIGRLSDVL